MHFDLAGPKNNKPGYYDWDKNNFAPRSPSRGRRRPTSGFFGALTGNGKMVVRGGYSIVYDRIGTAPGDQLRQGRRVRLVDRRSSSPFGGHNEDDPSIRFQGLDVDPADAARRAARRLPADAAVVRRHHHRGARRQHRHAVQPLVQRGRRSRARPRVLDRSGVCRPPRTQSAGAARRGHAGQRRGLRSRASTTSPPSAS